MYEKQSWYAASVLDFWSSDFQKDIDTKLDKTRCFPCYRCLPIINRRDRTHNQLQECYLFPWYRGLKKKFNSPDMTQALSGIDRQWIFQTMKINIQSIRKIVWEVNLENFRDKLTYKNSLRIKNYFWYSNSDVENGKISNDFFWRPNWAKTTKMFFSRTSEH